MKDFHYHRKTGKSQLQGRKNTSPAEKLDKSVFLADLTFLFKGMGVLQLIPRDTKRCRSSRNFAQ